MKIIELKGALFLFEGKLSFIGDDENDFGWIGMPLESILQAKLLKELEERRLNVTITISKN